MKDFLDTAASRGLSKIFRSEKFLHISQSDSGVFSAVHLPIPGSSMTFSMPDSSALFMTMPRYSIVSLIPRLSPGTYFAAIRIAGSPLSPAILA